MMMLRLVVLAMWLGSSGCSDGDADLPAAYRRVVVPVEQLASAAARARGRALFADNCALCHGVRGDGRGMRREGLGRAPTDFTSVAWRARTSPRRAFAAIREGVPASGMPAWTALGEADAWDLVAYVRALGEGGR